ncbi:hypothetical protein [Bradyrhizobium sp. SEMIA]|uniref:hypothetical protein n=1 Tax=Bradyrhizobium sp. SEMIA TaxID=2597515 RepID=UPI002240DEA5|nr:hypothetical protein [Bradyrhizobium sp. SEMIA]
MPLQFLDSDAVVRSRTLGKQHRFARLGIVRQGVANIPSEDIRRHLATRSALLFHFAAAPPTTIQLFWRWHL